MNGERIRIKDDRSTRGLGLRFEETHPGRLYEVVGTGALVLGVELNGERMLLPFPKATGVTGADGMGCCSAISGERFTLLNARVVIE